ncbi:protein-tyrosine-phosphatase [Streptomyces sp. Ru71]|uniref:tyrosine-protein phosphatase n=1 Tax=Streptomyces sp. Ru71 TaxID=2080746 RepID=UPI000CDDB6BD|nr:tyrosine-protein phosphatase [Streptomyces sp. Ru71]POX57197.1 protein-tyrosine-phosphatase [Streptomyces sp. Ru71]
MRTPLVRHLTTAVVLCTVALGSPPIAAAAQAPAPPTATAPSHPGGVVPLDGAVNVRDLGGLTTVTGRQVRHGRVFRADSLARLTDADVTRLSALGLRTVVDFRVPDEVRHDGADRLPDGLTVTSRPVTDLGLSARLQQVIGSADPVRQQEMLGDGKAEEIMRSVYRAFVTDPTDRRQFADTVRDIADHRRSPLLYHCTSGKDRTGWMSYLLLRAVGVPSGAAEQDYLLSNALRADADRAVREGLRKAGLMQNPDLLIPLQEVREDYLEAALAQAEHDYGGLLGYLTEGLGLDVPTLARLRAALLK